MLAQAEGGTNSGAWEERILSSLVNKYFVLTTEEKIVQLTVYRGKNGNLRVCAWPRDRYKQELHRSYNERGVAFY